MWLLKGILVGMSIFVLGFALYLALFTWRKPLQYPKPSEREVGETTFDFFAWVRYVFLQSPLFYAAFLGALLLGCSLVTF
jgi:hypothetical protein